MGTLIFDLKCYFWISYRRRLLDKLLTENKHYYQGVVLDIGGRDRGLFEKPKERVKQWIFADINKASNPGIVTDVSAMDQIPSESTDVVNAIELFEHVEKIESGIKECQRILKKNAVMILSVPFLYPIHSDPGDFQRWTKAKWEKELKRGGFKIEKFIIMGRFFTVLADTMKVFTKSTPLLLRWILFLGYPILDLLVKLDNLEKVKNHPKLGRFHGGYFIVAKKG